MYKLTKATVANAVKADNRASFITEKFVGGGIFTRAEKLHSERTGAHGIGFDFKSHDGAKASFSVWTHNDAGAQWSGFDLVMAIMTVLNVFELKPKNYVSNVWDREAKENADVELTQYVELIGVDVGVLIRMVEEARQDGDGTYWKAELNGVYRTADDLTASEIIAKKAVPERLEQLVAALKDKPMKKGGATTRGATGGGRGAPAGGGGAFPDDDIPF
jgi:hypothetical protein